MAHRHDPARKRHRAPAWPPRGRKRLLALVSGAGLVAIGVSVPAYAATHGPGARSVHPVHRAHPVHPAHPARGAKAGASFSASRATTTAEPRTTASSTTASSRTEPSTETPTGGVTAPTTAASTSTASTSTPRTRQQPPSAASTSTASSTAPAATAPTPVTTSPGAVPRPDHIVIVVEENHSFDELASLPYSSTLTAGGAKLTRSYALTHPSQPNYLGLWSGSTQGVTDDSCNQDFGSKASLGSQLIDANLTVAGYLDALPSPGYTGCTAGTYARKHNPLADFSATSDAKHTLPFTAFPTDFAKLPTVSFVAPDLDNDMHDGSVEAGDAWLKSHLGAYAEWAKTHNSLLILTADEDDDSAGNHILTVLSGQHVRSGVSSDQKVNHYSVLHTIEDAYGLPHLGPSAASISGIWK
jgi:phosphatidylinositol-3-phosphatase